MQRKKLLTPHEEASAKRAAFEAFKAEQLARQAVPQASTADLVQTNPMIAKVLTWVIGAIPLVLAVIMAGAILISSDKTYKAFSGAATTRGAFGLWAAVIGASGVIMTEGALVYIEFAATRSRLMSNKPRRVATLPGLLRVVAVRIGGYPTLGKQGIGWRGVQPLDYEDMPDTTLERFSILVFVLVLSANLYVNTHPYLIGATSLEALTLVGWIDLGFAAFLGLVAPIALRNVGGQLAHFSYALYLSERERRQAEIEIMINDRVNALYDQVKAELESAALHKAYLDKNRLEAGASSPYLLVSGEEQEPIKAIPLAPSLAPLVSTRINGNGKH